MANKAFSLLEIKSLDNEARIIRGIATTPTPDRIGDIIEPLGVKVASDIPLFLYHDSQKVVGRAQFGKATRAGIPFEAMLPKVIEAGTLQDRIEEAWQTVKYGLITGVSIGFKAVQDKVEMLKTGGLRFLETEVLELSLVPVPANSEAVIQTFKAMNSDQIKSAFGVTDNDQEREELFKSLKKRLAASGHRPLPVVKLPTGVTVKSNTVIRL